MAICAEWEGALCMPQLAGDSPPSLSSGDPLLVEQVERARGGESAAFTALFEHFNARIFRYLERVVGNAEIGRDLTQETFIAAWRALPTLQDSRSFSAWLYRIATNMARLHLSLVDPEEQVGQSEAVRMALAELAPKYRICLLLQLEGGFSQREIAQLLGINEKSVSANISRGRQQFRQVYLRLEHES